MTAELRRTTIPTSRLKESISFYERVVGMHVCLDKIVGGVSILGQDGGRPVTVRVVIMQHGNSEVGLVGLMEYLEPQIEVPPLEKLSCGSYPVFFVFAEEDVNAAYARVLEYGARVVCPPTLVDVPGKGPRPELTCLDPNGVIVNFITK